MFPNIVQALIVRELSAVRRSVELYPDDASLWIAPPGIANSAGNLVLHLCGNVQALIGANLGSTGYVRDRPLEFSRKNVPRAELVAEIDKAIAAARIGVAAVTETTLWEQYPDVIGGRACSTGDFLVHLVAHAGYHLGQIDYHRRIVTGDARTANAVPVPEIPAFGEPQ